jgi:LmbE family N-acetylglucosaminyl deacetylase
MSAELRAPRIPAGIGETSRPASAARRASSVEAPFRSGAIRREPKLALPGWLARRVRPADSLVARLPFQPLDRGELARLGTVLVVAPHPDDESLGCGGLIASLHDRGQVVDVVVVTDGAASHPRSRRYPAAQMRIVRQAETLHAVAALGPPTDRVKFVGLPDGGLPRPSDPVFATTVDRFAAAVDLARYDTVLVPWRRDPSPDHVATREILLAACSRTGMRPRVLEYPIWALVDRGDPPHSGEVSVWRLDIASVLRRKREAIDAHRSQLGGVVKDDPQGFRLSRYVLRRFLRPVEWFFESRR